MAPAPRALTRIGFITVPRKAYAVPRDPRSRGHCLPRYQRQRRSTARASCPTGRVILAHEAIACPGFSSRRGETFFGPGFAALQPVLSPLQRVAAGRWIDFTLWRLADAPLSELISSLLLRSLLTARIRQWEPKQ